MLNELLSANRAELIERCQTKVARRPAPYPTWDEMKFGIPIFLDQLIEMLHLDQQSNAFEISDEPASKKELSERVSSSAKRHAVELQNRGLTVDQVVHDYGDLCQAVTELAFERNANIDVREFHTLNRLLDNAIAAAVTEYCSRPASAGSRQVKP
ncbi:MAG TPA: hypothetical protein VNU21_08405 [Usitatibacter sp.]|jgi:hypothetical protein|nr:hypothetical protein [Usitatibacter sp.]